MIFPNRESVETRSNVLSMCLQPDEGIHLRFEAKVPDTIADTRSVNMDYHYSDEFGPNALPEAYERLLLDVINGDASLFTRADQTELSWELFDPIIQGWQEDIHSPVHEYKPGSWGPVQSAEFLGKNRHKWIQICGEHCRDGNGETTDNGKKLPGMAIKNYRSII